MIALPASWLPLIADYTRFSRGQRDAFAGSAVGYLIPNAWLYALGALLVLANPAYGDSTSLLTAIATGGLAAGLALLALTVDETDEAFANIYSTAVSLQNVASRVPQRAVDRGRGIAATVGALAIDLVRYQPFLFMLGSFFVPLFGVLLADWLVARQPLLGGRHLRGPAVRPAQIAAWAVGFLAYQWLHPVGPAWWTDVVGHAPARHRRRFVAELRDRVRSCRSCGAYRSTLRDRSVPCRPSREYSRSISRPSSSSQEPAMSTSSPRDTGLPRVVASRRRRLDRRGCRRHGRPPLLVSHDSGRTWRDSGRGLPAGFAVAVFKDDPDVILFAGRNRLFVSRDGGRFWEAIAGELPDIEAVAFAG